MKLRGITGELKGLRKGKCNVETRVCVTCCIVSNADTKTLRKNNKQSRETLHKKSAFKKRKKKCHERI